MKKNSILTLRRDPIIYRKDRNVKMIFNPVTVGLGNLILQLFSAITKGKDFKNIIFLAHNVFMAQITSFKVLIHLAVEGHCIKSGDSFIAVEDRQKVKLYLTHSVDTDLLVSSQLVGEALKKFIKHCLKRFNEQNPNIVDNNDNVYFFYKVNIRIKFVPKNFL